MARNQKRDKAKVLKGLSRIPNVEVVCRLTGLSRATHYRWAEQDSEYAEACASSIEHARSMISAVAESHVIEGVKSGVKGYVLFWLKHHHSDYKPQHGFFDTRPPFRAEKIAVYPLSDDYVLKPNERYMDIIDLETGKVTPFNPNDSRRANSN